MRYFLFIVTVTMRYFLFIVTVTMNNLFLILIERFLSIERILTSLGGWVGGQLLIIKLTSAQLSFAASGTWLSLANDRILLTYENLCNLLIIMKVYTYSHNTGEKLSAFALSPIVVENHRVIKKTSVE